MYRSSISNLLRISFNVDLILSFLIVRVISFLFLLLTIKPELLNSSASLSFLQISKISLTGENFFNNLSSSHHK